MKGCNKSRCSGSNSRFTSYYFTTPLSLSASLDDFADNIPTIEQLNHFVMRPCGFANIIKRNFIVKIAFIFFKYPLVQVSNSCRDRHSSRSQIRKSAFANARASRQSPAQAPRRFSGAHRHYSCDKGSHHQRPGLFLPRYSQTLYEFASSLQTLLLVPRVYSLHLKICTTME